MNLISELGTWLHDVFVAQFDGWILLGFVAQGFFTMRFVVQWLATQNFTQHILIDFLGTLVLCRIRHFVQIIRIETRVGCSERIG